MLRCPGSFARAADLDRAVRAFRFGYAMSIDIAFCRGREPHRNRIDADCTGRDISARIRAPMRHPARWNLLLAPISILAKRFGWGVEWRAARSTR
jgi:hypothetical protein